LNKAFSEDVRCGSLFSPIVKKRSKSIQFRSPSVAEFNDISPPSHVPRLPQGMPRVIDMELRGREDESSCSSILSSWLATAQSRIAARSDRSRQEKQPLESIIPAKNTIDTCNEDVEQTRAMISKIITKPKCSDKLLSKPPFRFIHDLVMNIGKATEFDLGMIFR